MSSGGWPGERLGNPPGEVTRGTGQREGEPGGRQGTAGTAPDGTLCFPPRLLQPQPVHGQHVQGWNRPAQLREVKV